MKKIALTLIVLALAVSACAEVPTGVSAESTRASSNGGLGGSGN